MNVQSWRVQNTTLDPRAKFFLKKKAKSVELLFVVGECSVVNTTKSFSVVWYTVQHQTFSC